MRRSAQLALLCLLARAAPALAAIEGSPHDLIAQGYDVAKISVLQERCDRCHIPSSAAQPDVVPAVPPVLAREYAPSSLLCFSCHDGTTIVSPDVDASRTAFHPASHGNDLTGYEGLDSEAIGLPYLLGRGMECITCHSPHDNGHRPFLRADLQELCLACHSKLAEYGLGTENRTGSHVLASDPLGSPQLKVPLQVNEAFRTAFPSPYPPANGKAAGGWHWELGGHLSDGQTGSLGCATCHAVHGSESAPPIEGLLAVAPVNDVANLFCEGCHAGTRGDAKTEPPHPNPGGTTTGRTYHPVDDDEANGLERLLEIREPAGWPFGGGNPRRLLCTTCHAPHAALVQTPLLRTPAVAPSFCEECHETVPDYHHQVGELDDSSCSSKVAAPLYGETKGLYCASCHRAHNAGLGTAHEDDYVPLLRESRASDDLCVACHPAGNPTCATDPDYQASHFLGDPTLSDTFEDAAPPLRRDPWPESGLSSVFGGEREQVVLCFSCHSFRKGTIVADNKSSVPFLVARAGNSVEWEAGTPETYLCTGCHGENPGTGVRGESKGHSHPTMSADATKLGREVVPPVSLTPNARVNCDSCHRSHAAPTRSGYYILEDVTSENQDAKAVHPKIDFTVICHHCHDPGKY